MRLLMTFFIGAAGFAALYAGLFVVLPFVGMVAAEHGQTWGALAFAALLLACALAALGLLTLHNRLSDAFVMGGRAPRDVVYCHRCGHAASVDAHACGACGGTRLGIRRPARG
jgi:ribosomal protein L37E